MDCIAGRTLNYRRFSAIAVTLLFTLLTSQPGYSESGAALPDSAAERGTAPAVVLDPYLAFSKIAVGVTLGTLGPSVEVATPLSVRSNLRVDGSFLTLDISPGRDGLNYNGNLNIREFRASYDFFPFYRSFRLSAGIAAYSDLNFGGAGTVAKDKSLYLNGAHYFTSAVDPISAKARIAYPNKVAPILTIGWGNAIPRSGRRFGFPVEIGAAYYGAPSFNLNITGAHARVRRAPAATQARRWAACLDLPPT